MGTLFLPLFLSGMMLIAVAAALFRLLYSDRPILDHQHAVQGSVSPNPLLGTYKDQPQDGHEGMTIGINLFRESAWERLDRMLTQPFVGPANSYPINARESAGESSKKDTEEQN
jgi:hypothetical protein